MLVPSSPLQVDVCRELFLGLETALVAEMKFRTKSLFLPGASNVDESVAFYSVAFAAVYWNLGLKA